MSKTADFLVEIGTEELPPNDLQQLSNAFASSITQMLTAQGISFASDVKVYASPRRIATFIPQLALMQPEQTIEKRGPAIAAAFNPDGSPNKAALGFAQSCGVDFNALTTQETDKGKWLYFKQAIPGKKTSDVLPQIVETALQKLPIKRRMRWGAIDHTFVRPIHWIVMLLGEDVVKANILGIETNNITRGHRIHQKEPIKIDTAQIYADKLEQEGFVIADFNARKTIIANEIAELAQKHNATAVLDDKLLDLVTGLVEFPVALLANFDTNFLRVPKECLISAMQDHQKCFALLDKQGNLLPKFILISNLRSTDPDTVIRGNELVMHARLADAQFHYDNDLKRTLESRIPQLQTIVYQQQLGSLFDKVERIKKLAAFIAPFVDADVNIAIRSANLCKCDLVTNMVYEFPELQGIMGYYYALNDKEPMDVALALSEYYKPKGAGDSVPTNKYAQVLALADRIDTLVGFFGINLIPTGEKDPYALRRQALAVIRILIDRKINLNIEVLFTEALAGYKEKTFEKNNSQIIKELSSFFNERLKHWFASANIAPQVYSAVHNVLQNTYNPLDIFNRIQAVVAFLTQPEALQLSAANKRVTNLLNAQNANNINVVINKELFATNEEKELFSEIEKKKVQVEELKPNKDYTEILLTLTSLQKPIDVFFEKVMVNVDDEKIKQNRLSLLKSINKLFTTVADISLL